MSASALWTTAAMAEATLPKERWPRVAGLLVLWTALWILLVTVL